jgi:hypothetical protein
VANPDGKTVGTYVYPALVRFKDGKGNWQAIDTSVVKPKALKSEVNLSAGGDTGLLFASAAPPAPKAAA